MKTFTIEEQCRRFGCTVEQARNLHRRNLEGLREMHAKALASGRKVNNYTEAQLAEHIKQTEALCAS